MKTFLLIKAVSDTVFDMINAVDYDKPLILIWLHLREALLQSSGSEYKFLNMFKFIKVVSDTVSDMINAVYCDKPLIESI